MQFGNLSVALYALLPAAALALVELLTRLSGW